jgi:hypothetical protein
MGLGWQSFKSGVFGATSQLSANASSWLERANSCDNLGSDKIEYLVGVDFRFFVLFEVHCDEFSDAT